MLQPSHPNEPFPPSRLQPPPTPQQRQANLGHGRLPVRKHYGIDCICSEVQPRRGKNLPHGSLDSRAKKLHPQDKEDYEFSISWLSDNAHVIYRDENNHVVGLTDLAEVSLCKAHSSTLYRAKKKHERTKAPPSPANSSGMDVVMEERSVTASPYVDHYPHHHPYMGGLAAKVRELSSYHPRRAESPDLSIMTPSTSMKRKRTTTTKPPSHMDHKPYSSASTPLYTSMTPFFARQTSSSSTTPTNARQPPTAAPPHPPPHVDSFSSQLPPLHTRGQTPISPLPSTLSRQETLATTFVETVSLKSASSTDTQPMYYIRNLAITDTFTFRDLLAEVDMTGSPPPGKRIVVSDANDERTFPLDQAIRSVIRHPPSSHVELCLGLSDKASIDWSTYT
ncbi:hypothetical protein EC973_002948 [Apophysomyces ossiformis]|uniref:Uncharacterized protein n=1 Tax=Apophysomyces ossiformis TaxID=679940 RepID=A0A8H7ENB0_9FUNG|nr:hypothetical protein EC973_002948 [Apophysomyces ossiformis]